MDPWRVHKYPVYLPVSEGADSAPILGRPKTRLDRAPVGRPARPLLASSNRNEAVPIPGEPIFIGRTREVWIATMDADDLQAMLEKNGELMLAVSEFDQPIELHLHDTEIGDEMVRLELTDGILKFDIDEVTGAWQHTHSLADLGLE